MIKKIRLLGIAAVFLITAVNLAAAQSAEVLLGEIDTLKGRVRQLEDYIGGLESRLQGMESSLENNFNKFQDGVKSGLEVYSRDLQINVNDQIRAFDDSTAVLDIVSKSYQKIDTNSGYFLIAIRKVQPVVGGYRLTVNIGNPNFADYSGIKLNMRWGKKYEPGPAISYDQWRQTLAGAQYSYNAKLNHGTWVEFTIDVPAESTAHLGYIECGMDVQNVELNIRKPN